MRLSKVITEIALGILGIVQFLEMLIVKLRGHLPRWTELFILALELCSNWGLEEGI
jgi:hypothetical protein